MKLQREYFSAEKDGFFGAYFPNPKQTDRCMIALLGDDIDDYMARTGAKWLMQHGCNVMTMAPSKMDERLKTMPHDSEYELALYPHGTHFVFPESMLRMMLPVGSGLFVRLAFRAARQFPKECRAA